MKSLEQFKDEVLKRTKSRNHRIKGSIGVQKAYIYYRKNKPKDPEYILTESQYYCIIRHINNKLADLLVNGEDIIFPCRMGRLEVRKTEKQIKIIDGKVHTNLPIDWNRTLELWYEDLQAFNQKTLVRVEEEYIYKIYYNRGQANYKNKCYYEFSVNRALKKRLKQQIKKGKIDAMYLDKNVKYD